MLPTSVSATGTPHTTGPPLDPCEKEGLSSRLSRISCQTAHVGCPGAVVQLLIVPLADQRDVRLATFALIPPGYLRTAATAWVKPFMLMVKVTGWPFEAVITASAWTIGEASLMKPSSRGVVASQ